MSRPGLTRHLPIIAASRAGPLTAPSPPATMPALPPLPLLLLAGLIGYLFGSFPSGMLVARAHGNVDLTATGSGRTGATNVLRTLG